MILFFIAFEKYIFFFLYKTQVAAFYFCFFALDEGFQWDEGAFILCMSCLFVCVGRLPIVPVPLWLQGFSVYCITSPSSVALDHHWPFWV